MIITLRKINIDPENHHFWWKLIFEPLSGRVYGILLEGLCRFLSGYCMITFYANKSLYCPMFIPTEIIETKTTLHYSTDTMI